MTAVAMQAALSRSDATAIDDRYWRIAAISLLSVRFIQGFIYWGGGSRRFIYGPEKLDPHAPTWMANKFQTAMPGALFGLDHVIAFMLQHFWVLYPAIIFFSAVELVAGLALMAGLLTRVAALISMGLSVVLMAMFGWQGATCIDEWTMAACNLAMGTTLLLAGSGAYSLDNVLLRRNPALAARPWFRWGAGSLPLPQSDKAFRNLALALFAFVVAYNVGTYHYYRGSVVTRFHGGPVSPSKHHFTLSDGVLLPGGGVRFHIYLDGGTPETPAHILLAQLRAADGSVLATWDGKALSGLPASAIRNDFAYNRFRTGPFGIAAGMGAMATIELPPASGTPPAQAPASFTVTDVNGRSFTLKLAVK
jgi:uncharacterized membrane protein YphA (DoxX/SURF4 family)